MYDIYATADDVESGFRALTDDERAKCTTLLAEMSAIIDAYAPDADEEIKRIVAARAVRRSLGSSGDASYGVPIGATQGSMSAMGYTQSWQLAGGNGAGSGELYLSSMEKRMLGMGNRIGFSNPYRGRCHD